MLFSEEDAPELKKWIVKRLENTSDADADVLADYVLALLRHEGDTETVRRLCEEEIPDFLQEDSSIFVRDVFNAIAYKTYLPGHSIQQQAPFSLPSGPTFNNIPPVGPASSRKRSFDHSDGQGRDLQYAGNDRAFKQPRRGGNMGRGGFDNRGGRQQINPGMNGNMPGMPAPPLGMPTFDPNNPMASMLAMQAMGFPMPDMSGMPPQNGGRSRPRCRDYDTKGFCARGNSCRFEHGAGSIYVPPGASDEYDPKNAVLPGLLNQQQPQQQQQQQQQPPPQFGNFRGSERGRGRGRGDRGGSLNNRGGRRAEFSSDRPNFDRSKTAIVVEQIPEEKFNEDAVREFFSQFGNIVEINMQPYKRLAVVKYDEWDAAQAAYKSPKVIFDNRFVKVYWYSNPADLPQPPAGQNGAQTAGSGTPAPPREPSEPLDLEEFRRKQEEAQRVHEEKMKKKAETEAAQAELEKRREELLKNQEAEKKKLMEKLAARGEAPPSTSTTEENKGSSQTEALKAQLAALEAEAKSLGLDPASSEFDSSYRGRGRGRGGYRGRAAFVPRGRGAFRGRGGAPFSNAGAYNLDNRPKKIAISGVDFTDADKDESLRQYLLGIGEFTSIETTPSKTSITFVDRRTAEKFMYGTPGCDIPGVGKVDMAWVKTPLPPVDLNALKSKTDSGDVAMDTESTGDAFAYAHGSGANGGHGNGGGNGYGGQEQEMDYDVADDNDWGVQ